jgi:hypothetical protein
MALAPPKRRILRLSGSAVPRLFKEVTMSPPVIHPTWCDATRCDVSAERPTGTHCSRPVVLGPYPPGPVIAEISAAQGPPVPGYPWSGRPFIALALRDRDTELCLVPLGVELAQALSRVLSGIVADVTR